MKIILVGTLQVYLDLDLKNQQAPIYDSQICLLELNNLFQLNYYRVLIYLSRIHGLQISFFKISSYFKCF